MLLRKRLALALDHGLGLLDGGLGGLEDTLLRIPCRINWCRQSERRIIWASSTVLTSKLLPASLSTSLPVVARARNSFRDKFITDPGSLNAALKQSTVVDKFDESLPALSACVAQRSGGVTDDILLL